MSNSVLEPKQVDNPRARLMRMVIGNWVSQAIYAAVHFKIPDALREGSLSVESLSEKIDVPEERLYRLMRCLSSVGIFREEYERVFSSNELSVLLESDRSDSLRPLSLLNGGELYPAWGKLKDSIQTGRPGFDLHYEMPLFEFLKDNPDSGDLFDSVMSSVHGAESDAVIDAVDFGVFESVLDVGGGKGSLICRILERNPKLKGAVFDSAPVIERAKRYLTEAGVDDRCDSISGDFFKEVSSGGDCYLLRHVLHDWNDSECIAILRNIRNAIPPKGRLYVIETIIQVPNEGANGKLLDLNMMIVSAGMERSESAFEELLKAGGFILKRTIPTAHPRLSVLEAEPV